jgi:hypothetical protein
MEIICEIMSIDFNDYNEIFTICFLTESDKDEFFHTQELDKATFLYNYPEVFNVSRWKSELDDEYIIQMLEQYYEQGNEFPPQRLL